MTWKLRQITWFNFNLSIFYLPSCWSCNKLDDSVVTDAKQRFCRRFYRNPSWSEEVDALGTPLPTSTWDKRAYCTNSDIWKYSTAVLLATTIATPKAWRASEMRQKIRQAQKFDILTSFEDGKYGQKWVLYFLFVILVWTLNGGSLGLNRFFFAISDASTYVSRIENGD